MNIEEFNQDKYKRTGWTIKLYKMSNGETRFVMHVATGRKYWPLFSVEPHFELKENDPSLKIIKGSLKYYTFPMIDRFVSEIEVMLSDVYHTDIKLL